MGCGPTTTCEIWASFFQLISTTAASHMHENWQVTVQLYIRAKSEHELPIRMRVLVSGEEYGHVGVEDERGLHVQESKWQIMTAVQAFQRRVADFIPVIITC